MKLADVLSGGAVLPHLVARDKKQALRLLAAHAAQCYDLAERDVYATLSEREKAGCTALGGGVCMPHGRMEEGLDRVVAVFATLAQKIDFDAPDGRPVDLIFMLLSPAKSSSEHVKALAIASRILRDKPLCETLRAITDGNALYATLRTADEDAD